MQISFGNTVFSWNLTFHSMIHVFLKLFSSENYSDDFEDEEDVDAPLTPKEETYSKENPKSEKICVPKQVYIN